jgi:two-component system chemotaxis response regulator CheY
LILVVDDSVFIRKKYSDLLVKAGYRVTEALAKYVDEKPDGVLLGIGMPRMGGIHALHAIRRIDLSAKVVIISTMGQ